MTIESTETVPEAVSTETVSEPLITSDAPPDGVVTGAPAEGEPAPYVPNFKYKVLKEEKEVPEWIRGAVTDEATEKQVRELYEKADGIDSIKAHRDQVIQENEEYKTTWSPFIQEAQSALQSAKDKDYFSFFSKVGIPDAELIKYTLERIELLQNPEKLQSFEQGVAANQQLAQLQAQNADYESRLQQVSVQQREFELRAHLTRPEISGVVEAMDSRLGQGSFWNEVVRRGQGYAFQGRDVPVQAIVDEMVNLIGWQGQQSAPPPVSAPAAEPARRQTPASLPNFQGGGTSAVKKLPQSTDDLRRIYKDRQNSQG